MQEIVADANEEVEYMRKVIPYLKKEVIERDTEELLGEFARARNVVIKPPIPIEDIVEKHLKLGFEFDEMHRVVFGVSRSDIESSKDSGQGIDWRHFDTGEGPDILGAMSSAKDLTADDMARIEGEVQKRKGK